MLLRAATLLAIVLLVDASALTQEHEYNKIALLLENRAKLVRQITTNLR